MTNSFSSQATFQPLSSRVILLVMGFISLAYAHIIVREGITAKLVLTSVVFFSGMLFFVRGLTRSIFTRQMLFYLLITYIPFSKQIPMDFNHAITGLNGTNILVLFLTGLWFFGKRQEGESKWIKTSLDRPIFIFFILGLISIFIGTGYGPDYVTGATIQFYRKWMIPFFLYFYVVNNVRNKETINNIAIVIMMVTVIVGLMAIYAYMDDDEERIGGIFDDPNVLASFFNYYMYLIFGYFLLHMNRMKYWLLLIPFLICFRGVMVTFSRAGYLAFGVSLFAMTYLKSKWMLFLLLMATLFVFMNPAFLPEGIRYRLAQTIQKRSAPAYTTTVQVGNDQRLDESASDRVKVWRAAEAMIRDNPVFGIGYYLFESKILHYYPGHEAYDPHNQYLLIASEMGIPALLVFLWIIWLIYRNARILYKRTQDPFVKSLSLGFLGGLVGLLVSNIYGSRLNYVEVTSYFWVLTGLLVRLRMIEEQV
ncbi:MAG: O-antigen ligase family protein [Candidatus Omnitrophica bacterium]|nr:O-antigen ligase family protein [Candidatus Omnitrophota bacterium]